MGPLQIVLLALGGVLLFFVIPLIVAWIVIAHKVYAHYLTRSGKEDWSRDLIPSTDEERIMFPACERFEEENRAYMTDVEIENEGFRLKGIFLNYGYDRAVIIVCGRTEALRYSYYFGKPYKELGFNILVIDNRSHGLSEGTYNSLGLDEYRDTLKWIAYLHDTLGQSLVIGHGSCIGAANLVYAMTSEQRPPYVKGLILEGLFEDFIQNFNNHITEKHHNPHPVSELVFRIFRKRTGKDAHDGPIRHVDKLEIPVLYLYSREDMYSTVAQAERIFERTGSKDKEFRMFDKGTHSHVRVANEAAYDREIRSFVLRHGWNSLPAAEPDTTTERRSS